MAQAGVGLGWRLTSSGKRKYPVKEPPKRTVKWLEAESLRVRLRMGIR